MGQIITNTFFDDCEAIKLINGVPTLDLNELSGEDDAYGTPISVPYSDLAKRGLSERFFNDFPQSAIGLYLRCKRNSDELQVPLVSAGYVQGEDMHYCVSALTLSRSFNISVAVASISHGLDVPRIDFELSPMG